MKRGVWEAGGVPIEFPAMSLPETQMRPTAMLFRNLLAMEVEESIRANPIDGVVLMGGCDKTTPGLLMGAASVDLPAIFVSSGPMLNGKFEGRDIGSGTDVWRFSEAVRAGEMSLDEFMSAESRHEPLGRRLQHHGHGLDHGQPDRGAGHLRCPTTPPCRRWTRRRKVLAHLTGNRIVQLVKDDMQAVRHHDPRGLRERHPDACGDRRLDQCGGPPAGAGRPAGRAADPARTSTRSPARRRCWST